MPADGQTGLWNFVVFGLNACVYLGPTCIYPLQMMMISCKPRHTSVCAGLCDYTL